MFACVLPVHCWDVVLSRIVASVLLLIWFSTQMKQWTNTYIFGTFFLASWKFPKSVTITVFFNMFVYYGNLTQNCKRTSGNRYIRELCIFVHEITQEINETNLYSLIIL